jgi:hypothetical protein
MKCARRFRMGKAQTMPAASLGLAQSKKTDFNCCAAERRSRSYNLTAGALAREHDCKQSVASR